MTTGEIIRMERRKAERLKAFMPGRIVFNGSRGAIDCIIRDISATGAQLGVSPYARLPQRFCLHMPHEGTAVQARFAWRRGDRFGVSFDGDFMRAPSVAAGSHDPAAAYPSA